VDQLVEIQRNALDYARHDGLLAEDEAFYAERNAATVRNAEVYWLFVIQSALTSACSAPLCSSERQR
jgi:hypothetical protein